MVCGCEEEVTVEYENISVPYNSEYIPAGPDSLTALFHSETSIALKWRDNSLGEDGFIVQRKEGLYGQFVSISSLPADLTEYLDTNKIKANINYWYRICSFRDHKYSAYSNPADCSISFPAPENFDITPVDEESVLLQWCKSSNYTKGYEIYSRRIDFENEFTLIALPDSTATSYLCSNLDQNLVYEFSINAVSDYNKSELSGKKIIYGMVPSLSDFSYPLIQPIPYYLSFSPVDNSLIFLGGNNVEIWNCDNKTLLTALDFPNHKAHFGPDGTSIGLSVFF